MNGASLDILQDRLEKLKADFPEIFTEGKIDMEKFKATFTDDINFNNERYVLNWAGKSDAFKVLQIPTTTTLKPQPEESVNFDTTENIFIEGENLEVLKVLQKSYYGKIKCIIIDPPYNTGNDSFIYPDNFKENKADYEKRIGDKDEEGYLMKEGMFRKNSKDSGHYHSNWLSMMYPRLFLAKNLLREDGLIFVHIDDNEVHNLRMIMNEIFGEENSLTKAPTALIWQQAGTTAGHFAKAHEYILCYAKNKDSLPFFSLTDYGDDDIIAHGALKKISKANPASEIFFPKGSIEFEGKDAEFEGEIGGSEKQIIKGKLIFKNGLLANDVTIIAGWGMKEQVLSWLERKETFDTKGQKIIKFYFNNSGLLWYEKERSTIHPKTVLDKEIVGTKTGASEIKELLGGSYFDNPKPTPLEKYILSFTLKENDIALDFFGGSGTTAQAILELNQEDRGNRKFILVQLPELCDENSEACRAGYKTIADISKERIRRVIQKIETEQAEEKKKEEEQIDFGNKPERKKIDLGFKTFKLSPSNFKIWRGNEINEENLIEQLDAFTNPIREGSAQENMLYELMLKAGYLLTDKVERIENLYSIRNGELLIAIESMNQTTVDKMISLKPKKVITLDILFKGNDQLKTNTALQMKDAGVDFKTI